VDQTPAFLDSIRLTTFTLGTKAPRLENVKSYAKSEPDIVVSVFCENQMRIEETGAQQLLFVMLVFKLFTAI